MDNATFNVARNAWVRPGKASRRGIYIVFVPLLQYIGGTEMTAGSGLLSARFDTHILVCSSIYWSAAMVRADTTPGFALAF